MIAMAISRKPLTTTNLRHRRFSAMSKRLGLVSRNMETHTFLLFLLIILVAARVFAELAIRLRSPSVIGELVAGVVLGPSLLG